MGKEWLMDEDNNTLWSGNVLIDQIYEFLQENQDLIRAIKKEFHPIERVHGSRIFILRCEFFTRLVDFLEQKAKIVTLSVQHDIAKIVLNAVLLDGSRESLERIVQLEDRSIRIDILNLLDNIELKTCVGNSIQEFPDFIMSFYTTMKEQLAVRNIWWFVSFYKFSSKKLNSRPCIYYMIGFEFNFSSDSLTDLIMNQSRKKFKEAASIMAEEAKLVLETKINEEDNIEADEGFLVPVKNIWIVDRLRDELLKEREEKEKERKEKEKERKEKEKALSDLENALKKIKDLEEKLRKQ